MWRLMLLTALGLAAPVRADELADAVTLMQQCQQRTEACRLLVSSNTGMIKQMLYISTHTRDEKALWESHFSISSYQCIHTVKPDDVVNALQGMYGKYESAEHGTANLIFNAFSIAVATKCRIEV